MNLNLMKKVFVLWSYTLIICIRILGQKALSRQGKYRTYALFKPFFKREIYLETVKDVQKTKMSDAVESIRS